MAAQAEVGQRSQPLRARWNTLRKLPLPSKVAVIVHRVLGCLLMGEEAGTVIQPAGSWHVATLALLPPEPSATLLAAEWGTAEPLVQAAATLDEMEKITLPVSSGDPTPPETVAVTVLGPPFDGPTGRRMIIFGCLMATVWE